MAVNRKMEVVITAKDKTKTGTKSASGNLDKVAGAAKGVAIAAAAAGVALGTAVVAKSLKAWAVQEQAILQVEKRLKSTGAAAWTSSQQLQSMAAGFQKMTVFGDEAVLQMQSLLLTFKDVKGPIFEQATGAILDMASALAQSTGGEPDLRSAATMVGKALQDPVLGLTAMSRAGIQFSDDQKGVITALVETGDKAAAQTIILKELESQFKGAAGAQGLSGATKQAENAFFDLFEEFGRGLTKSGQLEDKLRGLTDYMGSEKTKSDVSQFAEDMANLGTTLISIEEIAWKFARNNPFVKMWQAAGAALEAPQKFYDKITGAVGAPLEKQTTGGLADFYGTSSAVGPTGAMPAAMAAPTAGGGISMPRPMMAPLEASTEPMVLMKGDMIAAAEAEEAAAKGRELYLANLQSEGEAFSLSLMTQEEQLTVSYEARQNSLVEMYANNILSLEEYHSLALQDEEKHSADIVKIKEREAKRKELIERQRGRNALMLMNNLGDAIASSSDKTNRASFERDKKMNIGLSVVNTATAVVKSYNNGGGWPWGLIPAAAMAAAGLVQINNIKGQSFEGGAGTVPQVAGGAPIQPITEPVAQPVSASMSSAAPVYNIQVMGNIIDNDQFARDLISPLEQARKDGVEAQLA